MDLTPISRTATLNRIPVRASREEMVALLVAFHEANIRVPFLLCMGASSNGKRPRLLVPKRIRTLRKRMYGVRHEHCSVQRIRQECSVVGLPETAAFDVVGVPVAESLHSESSNSVGFASCCLYAE